MKNLLIMPVLVLLLLISSRASGIENNNSSSEFYKISKVMDGMYYIYFDTIPAKPYITKGTIIEFEDYVALIEVSISDHKLSTDSLIDFTDAGEKTYKSIQNYFPEKPLKYLLSSHWHPHSIGSIIPFISRGVTVVTTKANLKRLGDIIDSVTYQKYHDKFLLVEKDSLIIKDNKNEIIAYKITNDEFTSVPTTEYLYFYMPRLDCFHSSCMYQRMPKSRVKGKEYISSRTEDLSKFLKKKNISPKHIISINPFDDGPDGLVSADTMNYILKNGTLPSEIEKYITGLADGNMLLKSDSIFKDFMKNSIPLYIINKIIYNLLAKKEFQKALEIAKFKALYFPSDLNSWDTLGEVYYFMGDEVLAKRLDAQTKILDPKFTRGGEAVWKKDLEEYKLKWEKLNP